MTAATHIAGKFGKTQIALLLLMTFLSFHGAAAQDADADQPSQETINKRIEEIFKVALPRGTGVTPEGIRYTLGKVYASQEEYAEIKKYGDRAVNPLAAYFDKSDFRAQQLAIRFLALIGGPRVLKILSNIAEKSSSSAIRSDALLNLQQYSWPDIADVVHRISTNDESEYVKSEARKMIEKYGKSEQ